MLQKFRILSPCLSYQTNLFTLLFYFYLAILGILSKFRFNDLKVVALIFLFGAFIELIHYYHPYRLFEFFDLLANLIGVTIAFLIFRVKK